MPLSSSVLHIGADHLCSQNIDVHILADGVSSCNHGEVAVALAVSHRSLRAAKMSRHNSPKLCWLTFPSSYSAPRMPELKSRVQRVLSSN